jgi:hypothetical protein
MSFNQTGGARLDFFNATYPFATLSGNEERLELLCMGNIYVFPKEHIRALKKHRGFISIGLRIEHAKSEYPRSIVFWASLFFGTSGFRQLKGKLEKLGYRVTE